MDNHSHKASLSYRISFIVASCCAFIFLLFSISIYVLEKKQNQVFVHKVIEEQVDIVFNKLEDYRIQAKHTDLSKALYSLDLVESIVILDKKCEPLARVPWNKAFPNICKTPTLSSNHLFVKIYNDNVSDIHAILIYPKETNILFGKYFIPIFLLLGLIFFILTVFFSQFLIKNSFNRPFKEVISTILDLLHKKDDDFQNEKISCPKEMRPIYDALIELRKDLDFAKAEAIKKQQLESDKSFGRIIAHNLKTPIKYLEAAINDEQASEGANPSKLDELKELILQIKNMVENMGLRFLSQDNIDQEKKCPSHFIAYLIEQTLSEFNLLNEHKANIKTNLIIEDEVYTHLSSVDKTDFKSVIHNLLNNAIEAEKGKHNITINISLVFLNNHILIKIVDNCGGISKEIRNSIFNEGFTTKKQGNGLGLYHAKKMIQSWRGRIAFTSNTKGTSFEISLPSITRNNLSKSELTNLALTASFVAHIEDSPLIKKRWVVEFKKKNIKLFSFDSPSAFEIFLKNNDNDILGKNPLFFIDSNLGDNEESGESYAKKLYDNMKVRNLFLSTSYEADHFSGLYWIREVIDKTPPWKEKQK